MGRLGVALALGVVLAGCAESEPELADVATVDTLPNGAIHVVSRPEGVWALTGTEPWRVEEDLRIGTLEGKDPYVFGGVGHVLPDALGRIWAIDYQAQELRVFDAEGRHIRTLGGPGEGPGEFRIFPCAFPGPGDEIWVESGSQWQRFDTAGTLLGGQPSTSRLGCAFRLWLPDGRFLAGDLRYDPETNERTSFIIDHTVDSTFTVAARDTFFPPTLPDAPRVEWVNPQGVTIRSTVMPFVHRPVWTLDPWGDLWITDGDGRYRIRRQTLSGDTLLVMERPYPPVPVPDSARAREIADLQRDDYALSDDFDPSDVPRVYPPFDRIIVGTDRTVWVRRQVEDGAFRLDAFAADGRFLGPVEVPPDFGRMTIQRITADHLYGSTDDELGVEYVVRLAIRKPGE